MLASTTIALAEQITVTDIAGRTVELQKNPQKVVLGEGRMIYTMALLDQEDPFQRVVGWKDDMIRFDPDAYRKYLEGVPGHLHFAKTSAVPIPGNGTSRL